MHITFDEIKAIIRAVATVTVFFTLFLSLPTLAQGFDLTTLWKTLLKVFISIGVGVTIHESFHKLTALPYDAGVRITGAAVAFTTEIPLHIKGFISLAGPLGSMTASLLFGGLALITTGFLKEIMGFGFVLNAVMSAYNLIPISPFDGNTIFKWNKIAWSIAFIVSFALSWYAYSTPIFYW